MEMTFWIVGQSLGEISRWEFQGIFDSEAKAVLACRNRNYFIAPAILNVEQPDETADKWEGLYYPHV